VGIGNSALINLTTSSANTAVGFETLSAVTNTGSGNSAFGFQALRDTTTGILNSGIGGGAGREITTGTGNVFVGELAGTHTTIGISNTALGSAALQNAITGSTNIAIGRQAASAYVGAESNNIVVSNTGVVAESNTIRIGTQGSGVGQQNRNIQAGIYGVTPAVAAPQVVIVDSAGQLGSIAGGITTATVIVTTNITLAPNTQYIIQGGPVNLLLPATSLVGDVIRIVGDNNDWTITQAAGQQINYGVLDTTLGVGGSLASSSLDDCVEIMCMSINTRWRSFTSFGNLIVT
jgi:hypothetical protein